MRGGSDETNVSSTMSKHEARPALGIPLTGYPQSIPYTGYPPPYQGYGTPPQSGTCSKKSSLYNPIMTPAPQTAYYSNTQLPFPVPETKSSCTFARFVLYLLIVIIAVLASMSIVVWLQFGSDVPDFRLKTLTLPHFEAPNDTFIKADWEANITVKNKNHKLAMSFYRMETGLVYKNYILDTTLVPSFKVDENTDKTVNTSFAVPEVIMGSTNITSALLYGKDMHAERVSGSLMFDLRIITAAKFTFGKLWSRQTFLRAYCLGLKVEFPDTTGGGSWKGGDGKKCFMY